MQNEKDRKLITEYISTVTGRWNKDNISRTVFYYNYFNAHPEIKWAFLASMVSRNAGWSMTDLKGEWFPRILDEGQISALFLAYERANWTIFQDATPQLLLYALSKKRNQSFLLYGRAFGVSEFMMDEWANFFQTEDEKRLLTALIINEQHVIEKPVLHHHFYSKKVFHSFLFTVQDWFHFSTVLFPTVEGRLYGISVSGFNHTANRVELGKKLARLLFHDEYFHRFYQFSASTPPTGSRYDYERYLGKKREGSLLRMVYPIIQHNQVKKTDWFKGQLYLKKMLINDVSLPDTIELTQWYERKRSQIRAGIEIENLFNQKRRG
ncbi:DUF2515 family protein [Pseudalkalibacillus hwajinpoensis]|uniref:DUF2515 family protein n=1 Tax=Guptibacillus hwajinpoensis TaxID=208199 RepID=UPI00325B4C6C